MSQTVPSGLVTAAIGSRAPFGPIEHLRHEDLVAAQVETLASPMRRHSLAARALFRIMDALYGRDRSLEKFRVLELVACVPYQAWENVAYVAVTHTASEPGFARQVFDRVRTLPRASGRGLGLEGHCTMSAHTRAHVPVVVTLARRRSRGLGRSQRAALRFR